VPTTAREGRVHAKRRRGVMPFCPINHRLPRSDFYEHARSPSPSEAKASSATASARISWLGSVGTKLGAWAKSCADNCAAATAYESLSRLSDVQLHHRGLSRDILFRDLSEGRKQGFGQQTPAHQHRVPGWTTMIRPSFQRCAGARAFQASVMLLALLAALAASLVLWDTTQTAAGGVSTPSTAQSAIKRSSSYRGFVSGIIPLTTRSAP